MGALSSRQNAGVEEVDISSNHAYKYPPKSGNYFGSHFIMGGERFDTPQPEAYLFGENADLNFLGSRPTPFPYPPPQANEPTKTLKSLVNIRKESLRLVKAVPPSGKFENDKQTLYNIEFTFDCDTRITITIYYFSTEEVTPNGVIFTSKEPSLTSETYHYKKGANQQFSQQTHIFDPTKFNEEDLLYNPDKEIVPVAIHCVALEGPDGKFDSRQSHTCIAVIERHSDGSYVIKALKQKIFVDGLCYLLQEIYGIENKNIETTKSGTEADTEDNGSECVICMCDVRDTLILPCRHLCLCNSCADSLRYQANNCPICRAPFRALLQIRALQKSTSTQLAAIPSEGSCDNIPTGYEGVSLIEALNGPYVRIQPHIDQLDTPDSDGALGANRSSLERSQKSSNKIVGSLDYDPESGCPPETNGGRILPRDGDGLKDKVKSPSSGLKKREKLRPKDTVKILDETARKDQEEPEEELDSEAEKLSPLLNNKDDSKEERVSSKTGSPSPPDSPQHDKHIPLEAEIPIDEVNGPFDQVTFGRESTLSGACAVSGEDSDYYTPEDPTTTILSPLHADKVEGYLYAEVLPRVSC